MEFSCHKDILYVMNLYMCGPNVGPRVRWLLVPWHSAVVHFPMYTVALHTLLGMSKVETHEQLKAQDLLVKTRDRQHSYHTSGLTLGTLTRSASR